MIAFFKLGTAAAQALQYLKANSLNDVPVDHWASKYIAWGVENGVISGMGNGNYAPSDAVTAVQMAKLLLVACGFTGSYVGPDWVKNVAADGHFIFSGDAEAIYALPATREEVALYMNNCMGYRNTGTGDTGTSGSPAAGSQEADAYKAEFAALRKNIQAMLSGTQNVTSSENGVVITTQIDTSEHLDAIHDTLEWMFLSTFLKAVPDYAASLEGVVNIDSTNAYAAALLANKDDLNALLAKVTEIRVSDGSGSVIVASGARGTLQLAPGASGTDATRVFGGFSSMLTNANLVTLGNYETAPMTYHFTIDLHAVMDDGSFSDVTIPYTFLFKTA
jgi:hypothetical protein